MTFEEINDRLPNGFHDSTLREINTDFVNLLIVLKMDLHISIEGDSDPDRYCTGVLKIIRPYLFFFEPPDPKYPFIPRGKPVNASGASVKRGENPRIDALLNAIPEDATAFLFFLDDWNSYLYLAGASVEFSWDNGA